MISTKLISEAARARNCTLFVFGALDWLQDNTKRSVSGRDLFDDLTNRGLWFCARPVHPSSDIAGTPALFYLKDAGVIAKARIDATFPVQQSDVPLLSRYGLAGYFRTTFRISQIVAIDPPIDLKPLIMKLAFISNKGTHWGTSLRTTPRTISRDDFDTILAAGL